MFRISLKNRKKVNSYFEEYCENTSIHGMKYLGEPKRSCIEKFWWFVTLTVCVAACGYLILQTFEKWGRSPVIVSFATKQTRIYQVPFPAVTICPEAKTNTRVFNYSDAVNRLQTKQLVSPSDLKYMEYLSSICIAPKNYSRIESWADDSPLKHIHQSAPKIDDVFTSCEYQQEVTNCSVLFKPVFTDEGVCYSFNMMDRDDIFRNIVSYFRNYFQFNRTKNFNVEKGFDPEMETYPRRAFFTGAKMGLTVNLKTNELNKDARCGDSLQGYKILLHHPTELPRTSQQFFRLPLKQAVVAAITPDMMTTTDDLENYSSEKRQCYFQSERNLTYFKIYNQQNCELECLVKQQQQRCGCGDFYMPRTEDDRICGPNKLKCMRIVEKMMMLDEITASLKQAKHENTLMNISAFVIDYLNLLRTQQNSSEPDSCNCLPACTTVTYNVETSQSELYWEHESHSNDTAATSQEKVDRSMLVLYFKDFQFIPSERGELYGPIELMANCGGLLGLFVGFSIISLVEIVYFVSLRWCCNIFLYGKKFWSGRDN